MTQFYIRTKNIEEFLRLFEKISGAIKTEDRVSSSNFKAEYLAKAETPDYFLVKQEQHEWITTCFNNFYPLTKWMEIISAALDTRIVVTMSQEDSDYYYLAVYDEGTQRREIEVCYGSKDPFKDSGDLLPFELERPTGEGIIFNSETILNYGRALGIEITQEASEGWILLRNPKQEKRYSEYLQKVRKPWWKFWGK